MLSANESQPSVPPIRVSRPLLKWAGGKTQMIPNLIEAMPKSFNNYIEPFIGGGALFFYLSPNSAVIADSNPELINLYQQVAKDYKPVFKLLEKMPNIEEFFYQERSKKFEGLSPIQAAARTIYLNRTCFNGLFRVNKSGGFNVPFGRYKDPKIADAELLKSASEALAGTTIVLGDYKLKPAAKIEITKRITPRKPCSRSSSLSIKVTGISDSSFLSKPLTDLYFISPPLFSITKGKCRPKVWQQINI